MNLNRLNTILPPVLKSKALEETESVSKTIARRLYQAVSNSSNASNVVGDNGESRFVPQVCCFRCMIRTLNASQLGCQYLQSALRPLVKSHSTPNLRTSSALSPSLTTSNSLLEDAANSVAVLSSSPSALQRRTMSLQNLSAEAIAAESAEMPLTMASTVAKKSFLISATTSLASRLSTLQFETPSLSTPANIIQAEDDYVTHIEEVDLVEEEAHTLETHVEDNLDSLLAASYQEEEANAATDSSTSSNQPSPLNVEWFSEPATSEDDIVVVVSPKNLKRRVSFSTMASVILIPTKEEYHAAGLSDHLWWRSWEMREFKYNAYREVQNIMEIYGISQVKEAFRRMSLLSENDMRSYGVANSHISPQAPTVQFGSPMHMSRSRSISGNLQHLGATSL